MELFKKHKNFALAAVTLIVLFLFSFYLLRPQFGLIRNKAAIIREQRSQIAQRTQILENQTYVRDRRALLASRLSGLEKRFFVPLLHEKILIEVSVLFGQSGLKTLTMNFNEPEKVVFKTEENPEELPPISYQQLLQEALELMEEGLTYTIPDELADASYGISRTSLVIMFRVDSSAALIRFLEISEAHEPEIRISSLELSRDQTGWVGYMTLHFYALPQFAWYSGE